jgi:hypothetical protein
MNRRAVTNIRFTRIFHGVAIPVQSGLSYFDNVGTGTSFDVFPGRYSDVEKLSSDRLSRRSVGYGK